MKALRHQMRDIGENPQINISRKPSSPITEGKREKAAFSAPVEAGTIVGLPAKSCIREAARREERRDTWAYSSPQPPPQSSLKSAKHGTTAADISASWEQSRGRGGRKGMWGQSGTGHTPHELAAMMGEVEGVGQGLVVNKGTRSLAIYILVEDMKWTLYLLVCRQLTNWDWDELFCPLILHYTPGLSMPL